MIITVYELTEFKKKFFLKIWRSIIRLIYITLDDSCCTINFLLKDPLCLAFSSFFYFVLFIMTYFLSDNGNINIQK